MVGTPAELKQLSAVTPLGTHWLELTGSDPAGLLQRLQNHSGVRQATVFGQSIHALVEADKSAADLGLMAGQIRDTEPSLVSRRIAGSVSIAWKR